MKHTIFFLLIILITGCVSKSKYEDLENELGQKNLRIEELEREVEEKSIRISELESYVSDLEYASRKANIRADNMSMAIESARSNLNSAEFWAGNGNDFFSTSHYNSAKRELDAAY